MGCTSSCTAKKQLYPHSGDPQGAFGQLCSLAECFSRPAVQMACAIARTWAFVCLLHKPAAAACCRSPCRALPASPASLD